MKDISKLFILFNYDLISRFNFYKYSFLVHLKQVFVFIKLRTSDKDFLINVCILSKIVYFWLKQKIYIFLYQKEYFRGSRNSLIVVLGVGMQKHLCIKVLNYFKNIIVLLSKKIDHALTITSRPTQILFTFTNLNYLLGLNINKYYKYTVTLNLVFKFNETLKQKLCLKSYEKIFI